MNRRSLSLKLLPSLNEHSIGMEARADIEKLLDRKLYLELFVRVTEDWRQRAQFIHELYQ